MCRRTWWTWRKLILAEGKYAQRQNKTICMTVYEQTQFWRPGLQWAETDMPANAPLSTAKLTNQAFLFALCIISWCTGVIKTNALAVTCEWTLSDICLWFKGPIENFIYDISLEFPVIPEGQTKGIVSSLSSCCVIISSDKKRRQHTTWSGLCKNSLFVHHIKSRWLLRAWLPQAALLMTQFQVRQMSSSIRFVFCCGCAATCPTYTFTLPSMLLTNSFREEWMGFGMCRLVLYALTFLISFFFFFS